MLMKSWYGLFLAQPHTSPETKQKTKQNKQEKGRVPQLYTPHFILKPISWKQSRVTEATSARPSITLLVWRCLHNFFFIIHQLKCAYSHILYNVFGFQSLRVSSSFRTVMWFLRSGTQRRLWLSADPENEWQYFVRFTQRPSEDFHLNFYAL